VSQPLGQQSSVAVASPHPGSPVVTSLVVAPRMSNAMDEVVAAMEKEATNATMVKKAMDDVAMVKKVVEDAAAVERAAAEKRAVDAAVGGKSASDAVATEGATMEVASLDVADSSSTPVVGAGPPYQSAPLPLPSIDSVAPGTLGMLSDPGLVPPFTMLILFHLDSSLCSVSPSSRTPTPGAD
jgi:hypothetical protein